MGSVVNPNMITKWLYGFYRASTQTWMKGGHGDFRIEPALPQPPSRPGPSAAGLNIRNAPPGDRCPGYPWQVVGHLVGRTPLGAGLPQEHAEHGHRHRQAEILAGDRLGLIQYGVDQQATGLGVRILVTALPLSPRCPKDQCFRYRSSAEGIKGPPKWLRNSYLK